MSDYVEINEGNVVTVVRSHEMQLIAIKRRHEAEDLEEQRRDAWRKTVEKLAWSILGIVGAELIIRIFVWATPLIHFGRP